MTTCVLPKASEIIRLERLSLLAFLYIPLGLIFLIIRLVLAIEIAILWLFLPDCWIKTAIMRFLFIAMGLYVKFNKSDLKLCPRILIGQKVSVFDYLATKLMTNVEFVDVETKHTTIPPGQCHVFMKGHISSKIKELESIPKYLFIQPQSYISSQQSAICPFNSNSLEGIMQAQLLSFELSRPIDVAFATGTNTSYWDLIWAMFSPITIIEVIHLGTIERETLTSNESFARIIQEKFAEKTKLPVMEHSEEELKSILLKEMSKSIDLSIINEKSNEFYSKLSSSDRFSIRAEVNQMIQEERVKYLSRKDKVTQ